MSTQSGPDAQRLTALFNAFSVRVFAYARRHVERGAADEVVSETFLIAWRRLREVPEDALPWLLVVARNLIANHRRKLKGEQRMTEQVAALYRVVPAAATPDEVAVDRSQLLHALEALSELEREALLLTGWDGLSDIQAARVCGCSARTFRVRLHRARKRLSRELDALDSDTRPARPVPTKTPVKEVR